MPENENARPQHAEIDDELMDLADESSPSVLRPILMIGVIATALWIVSDWTEDVAYFFSSSTPVEIGDITEFASKTSENANWEPQLPHNRLVSLSGIPTQRSQSARYLYSRMVGGWIFVEEETERPDNITDELNDDPKGDIDRTYFRGQGRMVAFSEMPERYNGLRDYYRKRYGMEFCETLRPEDIQSINKRRRDVILVQWKAEYDEASVDERAEKKLSEQPTDAQVREVLDNNPVCVESYLVQSDVLPRDHIWFVVASALFGLFMLFNLYGLIRWIRNFAR